MTNQITCYRIPKLDGSTVGFKLCIVDSPGFEDSRGKTFDERTIEMVKELFKIGIQNLDALCLVVKLGDKRLTPSQKYVFSSILELFAKDISDNMFILITNDDGESGEPKVLGALRDAGVPLKENMVFRFNNANLFKNESHVEWKTRNTSFKRFFDELQSIGRTSVEKSKDVLDTRKSLEMQLGHIQNTIKDQVSVILDIKNDQETMKGHEKDIKYNENFTIHRKVQRPTKVSHCYYCLNCVHCDKTCHFNCKVFANALIWTCEVMSRKRCILCGCLTHTHALQAFSHEMKTVTETETLEEMKIRYNVAKKGADTFNIMIEQNKKELQSLLCKLEATILKADEWITKLQRIALKPEITNIAEYIDKMVAKEKENGKPEFENRIKMIERVKQNILTNKPLIDLINDL